MGLAINQVSFTDAERERFSLRLKEGLAVLREVLADPEFGGSGRSYGAELELYIVGADGRVRLLNEAIVARHADPLLTLELNRYNLEYNLAPVFDTETPFRELQRQLDTALAGLTLTAAEFDARIVPIGILPTLRRDDFGPACMTEQPRYHALTRGLRTMGSGRFRIAIDGTPPLRMERDDVTMEGANTSFQFHYRVRNADFARVFNAFLLATPLVVGVAANSPTLFGHRLWRETRVPLFKHAIDSRVNDAPWHEPARVSFGQGWVRQTAYELFAQTVALHPPLLPVCSDADYRQQWRRGEAPSLDELRLHQNSVWPWLRPVYDPADGGHLRIELRALPAGPTSIDMMANAALYVGLAEGLLPIIDDLLPAMPFAYAQYNFYRAAQHGLDATLVWPQERGHRLGEVGLRELATRLLPAAREGLARIGLDAGETGLYLDVIAARLESGRGGASWQLQCLDRLQAGGLALEPALVAMLERYIAAGRSGLAVADWPLGP